MKTAVIYISNHGTSEKVAKHIANSKLHREVNLYNLRDKQTFSLEAYDSIVLGCSIHAGSPQCKMKKFIKNNEELLLQKTIGLFLCCMNEPEFESQFERAYPENIRDHAKAFVIPGGEFLLHKMNFIEKAIVKKVAKTDKSISKIDFDALDSFINEMFKNGNKDE